MKKISVAITLWILTLAGYAFELTTCVDKSYGDSIISFSAINQNGEAFSISPDFVPAGVCTHYNNMQLDSGQYRVQAIVINLNRDRIEVARTTFCSIHLYDFAKMPSWTVVFDAEHRSYAEGPCV